MVEIKNYNLFSVPVIVTNFGEQLDNLNKQLISDAIDYRNRNMPSVRGLVRGYQTPDNLETLYESYSVLKDCVTPVLYNTLKNIGFTTPEDQYDKRFRVTGFWANIADRSGTFHMPHIHSDGETVLAGVYYPTSGLHLDKMTEINPNEDYSVPAVKPTSIPDPGDLILFDPSSDIKRQLMPDDLNRFPYFGSEFCISPKKSTLVIFPHYLKHMVAPLEQENVFRMSIAFSLMVNR